MQSFDISFVVNLNQLLHKQTSCRLRRIAAHVTSMEHSGIHDLNKCILKVVCDCHARRPEFMPKSVTACNEFYLELSLCMVDSKAPGFS